MKQVLVVLVIIVTFAFVTKPSDQSCIDEVQDKAGIQTSKSYQGSFAKGLEIAGADLASRYGLRIEDNFIFKSIYLRGSDETIAIGFFGVVIGI